MYKTDIQYRKIIERKPVLLGPVMVSSPPPPPPAIIVLIPISIFIISLYIYNYLLLVAGRGLLMFAGKRIGVLIQKRQIQDGFVRQCSVYIVKKVIVFPVPSRDVTNQTD